MLDPTKYGIIWKAMQPEPLPEPDVWINCSNVALIAQLVMLVLLVLTYCTHPGQDSRLGLGHMKRVFFHAFKLLTTPPQKQVSQVLLLAHSRAGVAFAMLRLVMGVIQMYPVLSPLFQWRPSAIATPDCMQHTQGSLRLASIHAFFKVLLATTLLLRKVSKHPRRFEVCIVWVSIFEELASMTLQYIHFDSVVPDNQVRLLSRRVGIPFSHESREYHSILQRFFLGLGVSAQISVFATMVHSLFVMFLWALFMGTQRFYAVSLMAGTCNAYISSDFNLGGWETRDLPGILMPENLTRQKFAGEAPRSFRDLLGEEIFITLVVVCFLVVVEVLVKVAVSKYFLLQSTLNKSEALSEILNMLGDATVQVDIQAFITSPAPQLCGLLQRQGDADHLLGKNLGSLLAADQDRVLLTNAMASSHPSQRQGGTRIKTRMRDAMGVCFDVHLFYVSFFDDAGGVSFTMGISEIGERNAAGPLVGTSSSEWLIEERQKSTDECADDSNSSKLSTDSSSTHSCSETEGGEAEDYEPDDGDVAFHAIITKRGKVVETTEEFDQICGRSMERRNMKILMKDKVAFMEWLERCYDEAFQCSTPDAEILKTACFEMLLPRQSQRKTNSKRAHIHKVVMSAYLWQDPQTDSQEFFMGLKLYSIHKVPQGTPATTKQMSLSSEITAM